MNRFSVSVLFLIPLLFLSCSHGSNPVQPETPTESTFSLLGNYVNPDGLTPKFYVNVDSSSTSLSFGSVTPLQQSSVVRIYINNMSAVDSVASYTMKNITAREWVDGRWKSDAEFTVSATKLTKIAVVLVLDISASLGGDFQKVDRKSTCLNSSHVSESRMPSSA